MVGGGHAARHKFAHALASRVQCSLRCRYRGFVSSKIIGYVISRWASLSRHEGGRMILSAYSSLAGSRCCSAASSDTEWHRNWSAKARLPPNMRKRAAAAQGTRFRAAFQSRARSTSSPSLLACRLHKRRHEATPNGQTQRGAGRQGVCLEGYSLKGFHGGCSTPKDAIHQTQRRLTRHHPNAHNDGRGGRGACHARDAARRLCRAWPAVGAGQ